MNEGYWMGNLATDITLKSVNDKTVVGSFVLAVGRKYKKSDGTEAKDTAFLPCEIWDSGAETMAKYLKKGNKVLIRASVKQDNWEDKNTQEKRSRLKFRVERFWFVDYNNNQKNNETEDEENIPEEEPTPAPAPAPARGRTNKKNDDDIPF